MIFYAALMRRSKFRWDISSYRLKHHWKWLMNPMTRSHILPIKIVLLRKPDSTIWGQRILILNVFTRFPLMIEIAINYSFKTLKLNSWLSVLSIFSSVICVACIRCSWVIETIFCSCLSFPWKRQVFKTLKIESFCCHKKFANLNFFNRAALKHFEGL